jgi:hypothetical protein
MKTVSRRTTAELAATVALASVPRPVATGELQRVPVLVVIHNHAAVRNRRRQRLTGLLNYYYRAA